MSNLPVVRNSLIRPLLQGVRPGRSVVGTHRRVNMAKSMPTWNHSRRTPTCANIIGSYENRTGL